MQNQQETYVGQTGYEQIPHSLLTRNYDAIDADLFSQFVLNFYQHLGRKYGVRRTEDQEDITQMALLRIVKVSNEYQEVERDAEPITFFFNALQWARIDFIRNEGTYGRNGKVNLTAAALSLEHDFDKENEIPLNEIITNNRGLRPTETTVEQNEFINYASSLLNAKNPSDSPLTDREHAILKQHFNEGVTLTEIGKTFNITQSRTSQVYATAIKKLRHYFQHRFMDDCPESKAIANPISQ